MMLVTLLRLLFVVTIMPPVTFTTVVEGQDSAIEEAREVVVRTPEEWKALWKEHSPDKPMPAVDFSKSMVIGVFLGYRNTGGYEAKVASIDQEGQDLIVTWRESRPKPGTILTQVLTFPYHIVRIDTSPATVKFRKQGGG